MRRFGALPEIKGGDLNLPASAVKRYVGRLMRVGIAEVISLVVPRWITSTKPDPIPGRDLVGADHPANRVTLWPGRKPKRSRR